MIIVKNLKPTLLMLKDGPSLMPGINEISKADYEKVKSQIDTFKRLKCLEVVKEVKETKPASKNEPEVKTGNSLESMKSGEAVDLVQETYDESLLQKWGSTESRKSVLRAIKKQMEELKEKVQKGARQSLKKSESEEE